MHSCVLLIDMKDLKYPYYMTQNLYFLGLFLRNYRGGTQIFIHKNNYCSITYIVLKKTQNTKQMKNLERLHRPQTRRLVKQVTHLGGRILYSY